MIVNPDQISLPISESKNLWETNGIFSDHYLRTRLKDSVLWPKEESIIEVWLFCKELWENKYVGLAKGNEQLTCQELIEPVLKKLGYSFLPKTRLPVGKRQQEPDYILFADEKIKDAIFELERMAQYEAAISLIEVKKVNHPLDAVSKKETPGRFPHQQVRDYLQYATDNAGKPFFNWAILTNGNQWRLYCRNAHPGDYFEFNFENSIQSQSDFITFYALFRPSAFIKNVDGVCALDDLREESLQVQTKLEDDLRKRVFNILKDLANGFYRNKENNISENDLGILYDSCLIFLYRLLFILYAEGRGLLPVKPSGIGSNKHYKDHYSIVALIPKIKSYFFYDSDEFTELYERLLGLFHLINGDQPSRNKACQVPQYNGGLFDYKKHGSLEKWRIGDKTLANVLRGLVFSSIPVSSGETLSFDFGETIDYSDLKVQQLGSIYEGLLEHHLELSGDHNIKLVGDRSNRKATGTYYTPDYIVQYIVEETLNPICERIEKTPEVIVAKEKKIEDNSFAKEVLKLNILDPAMGSGHFLVRATEFLADQIVYHPTTELHIKEVPKGLSHEQSEKSYWRRRVVESCIYGVDLNPLAVELAKLSLWLTCIAVRQPLSFLDHHLRPGNSLIGAKLSELSSLPDKNKTKQISLSFGPDLIVAVSNAIKALIEIEETETIDVLTVKNKETQWQKDVYDRLEPYRTVANFWISTFFGLEISKTNYQHLAKRISENPKPGTSNYKDLKKSLIQYQECLINTKAKQPLHWELEFPEVFFDENGEKLDNPGFDAVIGNPPYGVSIRGSERNYLVTNISKVPDYEVYYWFIDRGYQVLKNNGYLSLIIPNSILFNVFAKDYRLKLFDKWGIEEILDFTEINIFEDATVKNIIFRFIKNKILNTLSYKPTNKIASFEDLVCRKLFTINKDVVEINNQNWGLIFKLTPDILDVIRKIKINTLPLIKLFPEISQGLIAYDKYKGQNKEIIKNRVYHHFENSNNRYKKWLYGEDVVRYRINWNGKEYIDYCEGIANPREPKYFIGRRLLIREIINPRIFASITDEELYNDPAIIIVKENPNSFSIESLLAIINSKLATFYHLNSSPKATKGAFPKILVYDVKYFPLPHEITAKTDSVLKSLVSKILLNKKENTDSDVSELETKIDQIVYNLYGLTLEEIEIIENLLE